MDLVCFLVIDGYLFAVSSGGGRGRGALWDLFYEGLILFMGFPCGSEGLPLMLETRVQSLGREDSLEKEMVTHSSILAWRIPRTEKSGRLQPTGSQRVGHD